MLWPKQRVIGHGLADAQMRVGSWATATEDWSGMGCAEAERSMRRLRMRDGMGGGTTLVECCCTDTGRERMGQSAKECGEMNHGAPLGNCF